MNEKLQALGIEVKSTSRGNVKVRCPKCSEGRRNKNEPCLSVNVEEGVWNCHNCGWAGAVSTTTKPKREYVVPPMGELKKLSEPIIQWFAARGISNQSTLRYRITESIQRMPQLGGAEAKVISFNYFSPDGNLVNVKYRDKSKNFKLVSGAQLIPYGLDVAMFASSDKLVWVEGECDVLACYEDGITSAISVPNGASKGSQKLEWLDDCYDYFVGKKHYIATDMDEAGRSLASELSRRLGRENCMMVEWPEKDANDTLVRHGSGSIRQAIDQAKPYPIEGIVDAVSVYDRLEQLYTDGAPTGYQANWGMDDEFRLLPRTVTMITGIPSHGKTTWLKNYAYRLARLHSLKFLVYSAEETSVEDALADLACIAYRKPFFENPYRERISREELNDIRGFLSEHFKYYSLTDNEQNVESILDKAEELVRRSGINAVIIDNMSTIERRLAGSGNKHEAIGGMMNMISRCAKKNDLNFFLVAHPKKMRKLDNGKYEIPAGYDIGDSSHWYNLPDNGFTVYRDDDKTIVDRWKVRSRYSGKIGRAYFKYDLPSGSFTTLETENDGSDKTKFIGQPYGKKEDYSDIIYTK